jgi:aminoglycoside phosphotransferase (APT) family kinase protein
VRPGARGVRACVPTELDGVVSLTVPDVDPRDADAVSAAVCSWVQGRFGGEVALAGPPRSVGAGFDSFIHLVQLRGQELPLAWTAPLVVRVLPSPDRVAQARAEASFQSWAAAQGFPAPQVLAVLEPDDALGRPAQVMERAPGVTMLDALKAKPWRALALARQLASLQLELHALDPGGWPGSVAPTALVDARLTLPRRAVEVLDDRELADALRRAEGLAAACAASGETVMCHGDFHPLNVMVDGSSASVIDWTDAGLGPREADVARTALLFHMAAIAAESRAERVALSVLGPRLSGRYLAAYRAGAALDEVQMRRWDALHALHGWAQVEMLHAGRFEGTSSAAGNESRIPRALGTWLQNRFNEDLRRLS